MKYLSCDKNYVDNFALDKLLDRPERRELEFLRVYSSEDAKSCVDDLKSMGHQSYYANTYGGFMVWLVVDKNHPLRLRIEGL